MTYQTICVGLLHEDARNPVVMETAIQMALLQGAHLTAVHLIPTLNIPIYVGIAFPDDMMGAYYEAADANGEELRKTFESLCNSAGLESHEWVGGTRSILTPLEELAPVTDLFVLSQHSAGEHDWLIGEASLRLGVPVFAVPEAGQYETFGRSVLLAWAPRRECTRAVRDAMPMLQAADQVVVLRGDVGEDARDVGVGAYLARHGVQANIKHVTTNAISIGDAILNAVTDEGCDTIVMGAYGHSRIREMSFGGATRHVLHHMTVPTLLSH
ncbi:MAG: universal stress protein [Alphaproteobacteria bacterium]|nr:universal stress protein [Alphaproteobacteria bacterium]